MKDIESETPPLESVPVVKEFPKFFCITFMGRGSPYGAWMEVLVCACNFYKFALSFFFRIRVVTLSPH